MYSKLILLLVPYIIDVSGNKPTVDTTHGKISGRVLKTVIKNVEYSGFMSIPYAAPPLKDLRFMPPQPVEPWTDILSTTKEKPACSQMNNNIKKGQSLGYYGSEDCLYLDVYTPALDDKKRAVIVFLYNENFRNSYNKTRDYGPDFFIEEDVVLVTISHRLAVFGFLSLEDELLSGNAGLKDIVAGLEWVRDNIARFGGDPDRVTLMGSKGGGAAVDLLMHSTAKGLFSAAILQSGSSWGAAYLQEGSRERAFSLGELLNVTATNGIKLLKELQDVPALNLPVREVHACPKDYFKETQRSITAFGPIVEKTSNGLITEYPENSKEKLNIPVMLGFNSREGLEYSMQYLTEPRFIYFLNKDFPFLLPRRLGFRFDPRKDGFQNAEEQIKKYYFKNKISIKNIKDFITYLGDTLVAYPVDYAAKIYASTSQKPVYYYFFDYYSDLNDNKNDLMKMSNIEDGTWGAASGDELCYLLKCPSLNDNYVKHDKLMSEERKIQAKLIKLWTNFAKYREPTPTGDDSVDGLVWPKYTVENKEYLHIHKEIEVKRDLYSKKFNFWNDFIERWQRLATDGVITKPMQVKNEL